MSSTTTRPSARSFRLGALPVLAAGVLALGACSAGGTPSSAQDAGGAARTTVTIPVSGHGHVLRTASGRTLYVSGQEKHQVLCTSTACNAIWVPLTVPSGDHPTAPSRIEADLSTIGRPDGTSQVTLAGRPLYTFSFDHGTGQVNGDGLKDSFDGNDFTWHAATPAGSARAAGAASSTSPAAPRGGGYGY